MKTKKFLYYLKSFRAKGRHSKYIVLIDYPYFGYGEWMDGRKRKNRKERRKNKIELKKDFK